MDHDYKTFLGKIRDNCLNLERSRVPSLGFNAFALMSDIYHRENFHSDILCEILNPNGEHKEGKKFLQAFFDLLLDFCDEQNINDPQTEIKNIYNDDDIKVTREEGRTDIAIYHETKSWVIIIENKINNAEDTYRQIPKYINYWKQKREKEPIAVIYLTASDNKKFPSTNGWNSPEISDVEKLLLPIPGYVPKHRNCIWTWLSHCELSTKNFNNKAVVSQYAALVQKQAGESMDAQNVENFLKAIEETKIEITHLQELLTSLPEYYTQKTKEMLADNGVFPNVWRIFAKPITVLDGFTINHENTNISFSIDIHCAQLDSLGVSFFVRKNGSDTKDTDILKIFDKVFETHGFKYDQNVWDDRYFKLFKLNPTTQELRNMVDEIKEFLQALVTCKDDYNLKIKTVSGLNN